MIWNELRCDSCGESSPGMSGRPRATKVRKIAAAAGWTRMDVDGKVRDLCEWCSRLDYRTLLMRIMHMDDYGTADKRGEKK
jgi:hypothetical protein